MLCCKSSDPTTRGASEFSAAILTLEMSPPMRWILTYWPYLSVYLFTSCIIGTMIWPPEEQRNSVQQFCLWRCLLPAMNLHRLTIFICLFVIIFLRQIAGTVEMSLYSKFSELAVQFWNSPPCENPQASINHIYLYPCFGNTWFALYLGSLDLRWFSIMDHVFHQCMNNLA